MQGLVSGKKAIFFATILGTLGTLFLLIFTNVLTACVATFGFIIYVMLYSLWKCRTVYGTAIGSLAGAVPPVVGYCAVNNRFDAGAVIFFMMMVFWQMPHFFAIAVYRIDDYTAASIPVFPLKKGIYKTKQRMFFYIVAFMLATFALTFFNYTGYIFLIVAALLGSAWLALCLKGFKTNNDHLWARQMFRLSLVIITILCIVIPFDL